MATSPNYMHDRPAIKDTLGRLPFAEALSRSLVLPKGSPGLVVGIEGDWGSGKSTLIGFVTKSLRENNEDSAPIVVEFNPWMVSNTGALVETLIGQIAASIGKGFSEGKKGIEVSQKLLNYVGLLKHLKYLPSLSWAGHLAEDIPRIAQTVAAVAAQGIDAGQQAIGDFKKLLPSLDISQKRTEVVAALEELGCPIVVVIDDLDRLPEDEIRAMIQAIKAVADFPRIAYLLAYDRSIIARALAASEDAGLSYLEKIVQVAYPIPPLSQRQLNKFANENVQALLNALNIALRNYEQDRYEEAMKLLTKLTRHPRDIVRVINRLLLSLPATHGEVNAADVIVFEALSQRFPALREAIHSHSSDFTGRPFRGDLIDEKDAFDWGYWAAMNKDETKQAWLKHLPKNEGDLSISEKACSFLFPPREKGGDLVIFEDQLRIADPDRLARLFRMTSIEEVPEAKEIHELLMDSKKLEEALSTGDEQLLFLSEWMINYTPSCPTPDVKGVIEKLIEVSQKLSSQCRLTDDVADKFADVMIRLLQRRIFGYNECFLDIAQNAPLSISEKVVWRAAKDQGKWKIRPESKVSVDRQLISDSAQVDQAIQTWSARVGECAEQRSLYKEANLHSILYRFAQFNDDAYEDVYIAVNKMCETEEGLAAFLRQFKEENIRHGDRLTLIEDAECLAQRITDSTLKDEYFWLTQWLGKEEVIQHVREQAAKLKRLV